MIIFTSSIFRPWRLVQMRFIFLRLLRDSKENFLLLDAEMKPH